MARTRRDREAQTYKVTWWTFLAAVAAVIVGTAVIVITMRH
ncbi:MAG: hypothetical protein ABSD09_20315 [Xanthobacteraceae bacterium]